MSTQPLPASSMPPCIVCKKELDSPFSETSGNAYLNQPNGAVNFLGSGAYGSGFDLSPDFSINVCDDCLRTAIANNEVQVRVRERPVISYFEAKDYPNESNY